jgi:hypothetical protein
MMEFLEAYSTVLQIGGGAIGGILLLLLKNRRPLLTYSVTHQRIGMTADDAIHGKVEVRFRDSVVHNLYLSVVELRNRSMRDLDNLNIKTYRDTEDTVMLTEQAHIEGTLENVNLTKEYTDRVTGDSEWEKKIRDAGTAEEPENAARLLSDARFRHGQRHYLIPVLNRGQVAKITYLVAVGPNSSPVIRLTSPTKGIRIKERRHPATMPAFLWGVPILHSVSAGLVLGAFLVSVIVWQVQTLWIAAVASFLLGALANLPGVLFMKVYGWLRERIIG